MGIALSILGLGLLLFLHELGHLLAAKATGIPVSRFSIGMGPVLFSRERWGIEWAFSSLPFGGYVMFDAESEGYLRSTPTARILTAFAGPLANLIVAFVFYSVAASLEAGGVSLIGGLEKTLVGADRMFHVLGLLFTGQLGLSDLGGPVMMVTAGASLAGDGVRFMSYLGFLSLNLAIFNLLPIPALDGGQILLTLFTTLVGHKPSERVQIAMMGGSFVLVMGLIAYVTLQDFGRLLAPAEPAPVTAPSDS